MFRRATFLRETHPYPSLLRYRRRKRRREDKEERGCKPAREMRTDGSSPPCACTHRREGERVHETEREREGRGEKARARARARAPAQEREVEGREQEGKERRE